MQNIEDIAAQRARIHASHTSSRPLSPDYELVGVAGEAAFAQEFGLKVDATARPEGDGGVDFTLPIGTVDVKTYRLPYHLLRETDKPHADILVLAAFDDTTGEAHLIGWEWDSVMRQCPTRDFGYGIVSHYKAAEELKPISELHLTVP
jgi:hypothetical protein